MKLKNINKFRYSVNLVMFWYQIKANLMMNNNYQNLKQLWGQMDSQKVDCASKSEKQAQQKHLEQKLGLNIQKYVEIMPEAPSKPHRRVKFTRNNLEIWNDSEIQTLFELYHLYGSQWKNISRNFHYRSTNSIKNRFYTVIRNLLKNLFFYHPSLPCRIPSEISSKIILKFYEGREQFQPFKNLGRGILREIEYCQKDQIVKEVLLKYQEEVKSIYSVIFHTNEEKKVEAREQRQCQRNIGIQNQCQRLNIDIKDQNHWGNQHINNNLFVENPEKQNLATQQSYSCLPVIQNQNTLSPYANIFMYSLTFQWVPEQLAYSVYQTY